jgi:hypothetical protein
MARLLALTGLAVSAALLATGCGGGGQTTVIERTVTTPTTTTNGTQPAVNKQPAVKPPEERETQEPTETQEPAAPEAMLHLTSFQSPSGNIGCSLLDGRARCDISKREWSPPPRPPGCPNEVDFGQGLEVGRNDESGSFVCAGDTTLNPEAPKLAYGSNDSSGGLVCASRTAGIACTNSSGHGFAISIQAYRTF